MDFINLRAISESAFVPFEFNDEPMYLPGSDLDPDLNYFNQFSATLNSGSKYYLSEEFNNMLTNQSIVNDQYFSLFHMNIRSTKANLPKTVAFAKCLQVRFSVLGFSETWLNEHEKHLYNIPGYNQIDKCRSTEYYSKGGGVSLFIDEGFVFREREDLCMGTDIWTSLFVEIEMNVKILIGIISRPPDSNLQMFNASLSITLDKIKSEKVNCYLMGDTNIDLFKHVSHKDTQEFLNLMYSNGFVPLINRPTRLSKDGKSALVLIIFSLTIFLSAIIHNKVFFCRILQITFRFSTLHNCWRAVQL